MKWLDDVSNPIRENQNLRYVYRNYNDVLFQTL